MVLSGDCEDDVRDGSDRQLMLHTQSIDLIKPVEVDANRKATL